MGGHYWAEFSGDAGSCKGKHYWGGQGLEHCTEAQSYCDPASNFIDKPDVTITAKARGQPGVGSYICVDNVFHPTEGIQVKTSAGESRLFLRFDLNELQGKKLKSAIVHLHADSQNYGDKNLVHVADFETLDAEDWFLQEFGDINESFVPHGFEGGWLSTDVTSQLNFDLFLGKSHSAFLLKPVGNANRTAFSLNESDASKPFIEFTLSGLDIIINSPASGHYVSQHRFGRDWNWTIDFNVLDLSEEEGELFADINFSIEREIAVMTQIFLIQPVVFFLGTLQM